MSTWRKSLRFRILRAFFILLSATGLWALVYLTLDARRSNLREALKRNQSLKAEFLVQEIELQKFQLFGFKDSSFYLSDYQKSVEAFDQGNSQLLDDIESWENLAIDLDLNKSEVERLQNEIRTYREMAIQLFQLYQIRGFQNYGLEGQLREVAHYIEDKNLIDRSQYLNLRRHEKDFINRADPIYIERFNRLINLVMKGQDSSTTKSLNLYKLYFNRMVEVQNKIGLNEGGLRGALLSQRDQVISSFRSNLSILQAKIDEITKQLGNWLYFLGFSMLAIIIFLSLQLSRSLSEDIKQISTVIKAYVEGNFNRKPDFVRLTSHSSEVESLNDNLQVLSEKLSQSLAMEREVAIQAEYNAKVKSYFLANMSHEIRTPLNGVLGMIHILEHTSDESKRKKYFNTIKFSAEHLSGLVNMVLDFSKIDEGKMELNLEPFNLQEGLIALVNMFQSKAIEQDSRLILDTEKLNLQHSILADSLRLKQVLMNLVSNALKFTENGTVRLLVSSQKGRSSKHRRLSFMVEDNGIGIPQDKLKTLFNPYAQSDRSIQRTYGGTGLGLSISSQLVSLMDSELKVKSKLGEGSLFYFEAEFELDRSLEDFKSESLLAQVGLSQKVLVAEDNPVNQQVIKLLLEKLGLSVDIAVNGKEALEAFEKSLYGLIFMDVQMPVMDGFAATKAIKASDRYQEYATPIVALTANAFNENREEALQNGCDDFLSKPIDPIELNQVLRKYLVLTSLS